MVAIVSDAICDQFLQVPDYSQVHPCSLIIDSLISHLGADFLTSKTK